MKSLLALHFLMNTTLAYLFFVKDSLFTHFWIICTFNFDYFFNVAFYQEVFLNSKWIDFFFILLWENAADSPNPVLALLFSEQIGGCTHQPLPLAQTIWLILAKEMAEVTCDTSKLRQWKILYHCTILWSSCPLEWQR